MPDSPERWLEVHGAALYRYALMLTREPSRAEEAVQDTLLAAWEARHRYTGGAAVRTWLIGILKHKVIDLFRREARERSLTAPEELSGAGAADEDGSFDATGRWHDRPADWGDPEALLQQQQFLMALQRCADRLPAQMAEVFRLREIMEEDAENICNELAISPTNLRTTLHRARLRLRQCLERSWGGSAAME